MQGQLNFYMNIVDDQLRGENDNKTIGLLLCKGKDEVVAQYALTGYAQPIGVSDYQLSKSHSRKSEIRPCQVSRKWRKNYHSYSITRKTKSNPISPVVTVLTFKSSATYTTTDSPRALTNR